MKLSFFFANRKNNSRRSISRIILILLLLIVVECEGIPGVSSVKRFVSNTARDVGNAITNTAKRVGGTLVSTTQTVFEKVESAIEMLERKVTEASAVVTSAAEVAYDATLDVPSDAFSAAGEGFQTFNDALQNELGVNLDDFEGFVQQGISFAGEIVSEVEITTKHIGDNLAGFGDDAIGAIETVASDVKDGLDEAIEEAREVAENAADFAVDIVEAALECLTNFWLCFPQIRRTRDDAQRMVDCIKDPIVDIAETTAESLTDVFDLTGSYFTNIATSFFAPGCPEINPLPISREIRELLDIVGIDIDVPRVNFCPPDESLLINEQLDQILNTLIDTVYDYEATLQNAWNDCLEDFVNYCVSAELKLNLGPKYAFWSPSITATYCGGIDEPSLADTMNIELSVLQFGIDEFVPDVELSLSLTSAQGLQTSFDTIYSDLPREAGAPAIYVTRGISAETDLCFGFVCLRTSAGVEGVASLSATRASFDIEASIVADITLAVIRLNRPPKVIGAPTMADPTDPSTTIPLDSIGFILNVFELTNRRSNLRELEASFPVQELAFRGGSFNAGNLEPVEAKSMMKPRKAMQNYNEVNSNGNTEPSTVSPTSSFSLPQAIASINMMPDKQDIPIILKPRRRTSNGPLCLEAEGPNSRLQLVTCNGGMTQKWYYRQGLLVSARYPNYCASSTRWNIEECGSTDNDEPEQMWSITIDGYLQNRHFEELYPDSCTIANRESVHVYVLGLARNCLPTDDVTSLEASVPPDEDLTKFFWHTENFQFESNPSSWDPTSLKCLEYTYDDVFHKAYIGNCEFVDTQQFYLSVSGIIREAESSRALERDDATNLAVFAPPSGSSNQRFLLNAKHQIQQQGEDYCLTKDSARPGSLWFASCQTTDSLFFSTVSTKIYSRGTGSTYCVYYDMAAPTGDPHVRMKTGCDTDAEDDPRPLCWSLDSEGQIRSGADATKCLEVQVDGEHVQMMNCDPSSIRQIWEYNKKNNLVSVNQWVGDMIMTSCLQVEEEEQENGGFLLSTDTCDETNERMQFGPWWKPELFHQMAPPSKIIAPGPNPSGWCIHDTHSKFGDQLSHVRSDHRCDGRFAPGGQLWYLLANGQLRNERTMLCASVRYLTTGYTYEERRYVMATEDCDATKMSQIWMYNATSLEFSTMVEEPDGTINRRCLDSGGDFVETRTYISVNRRGSRELFLSTNCGTESRFREFYM